MSALQHTSPKLSRRCFLFHTTTATLSAGIVRPTVAAQPDLPIVDCHAHIYGEDEKKYPTIEKPYRPPPGTGTVAHLQREMRANGVRYVTAIQTSTYYRWDNRFTVDSARANRPQMAAVCTLDPDDNDSPALLERYVRGGGVRGMRSIPAANGQLDHAGVARLWSTAERLGIVINVLVDRVPKRNRLIDRGNGNRSRRFQGVAIYCKRPFDQPVAESLRALLVRASEMPA